MAKTPESTPAKTETPAPEAGARMWDETLTTFVRSGTKTEQVTAAVERFVAAPAAIEATSIAAPVTLDALVRTVVDVVVAVTGTAPNAIVRPAADVSSASVAVAETPAAEAPTPTPITPASMTTPPNAGLLLHQNAPAATTLTALGFATDVNDLARSAAGSLVDLAHRHAPRIL